MTDAEDFDAIELEVVRHKLESVAEEMGEVLVRGAFSPNITERRDCSTALFDADGRLVAQAEHIPVHLGSMPDAVGAVLDRDPAPGDVFVLNDPCAGGTHLPDVTLVAPIASGRDGDILAYAAARAHHADVGGSTPGSMPAGARELHEEGLRIPPVRLVSAGEPVEDVRAVILANVRNPAERRADLRAQRGAVERGRARIEDLHGEYGDRLQDAFGAVIAYSRRRTEAEIASLPDGTYDASDLLEGDGVTSERDLPIVASVTVEDATLRVDFAGTAAQVAGNVNAPPAVARSAVYFVIRCVTDPGIPPNAGCYAPVSIDIPDGSLLNPGPAAAVVGGNVETSQRVADVVFAAVGEVAPERVPAAGQGTMNNVIVGTATFTYYETVGGGAGATAEGPGLSGVQVGMTNTENTPIEALEAAYPIRVTEYSLRAGSGGEGAHDGGDGIVRELRTGTEATVSLLTDRRRHGPPGRAGGTPGATGHNEIDGEDVPAKVTRRVSKGSTIRIETPGGGGYGEPNRDD
jgi:N-methylhydantoinase B